jgi:2-oxoglutarate dehydrogenase E1 component
LLRRQVKQETVRPLIVMTPKSLLRLPAASSTVEELTNGGFRPVIDDAQIADRSAAKRVVLCSGKVYYDLDAGRTEDGATAVVRLEQFYPFPKSALSAIIESYPNASEIFWTQEEPKNMGGWTFVKGRLDEVRGGRELRYVGREASASPATGSYAIHNLEQERLVRESFGDRTK